MACCTNCTLVRVKTKAGGLATHYDATGNFNFTSPPTSPQATLSNIKSGDTLIEYYDNALAFWTYDGTNWVLDFYHSTLDRYNTHFLANTNINFAALPTVPQLPPANPTTGDTLHEKYLNGQVFWTFNGIGWTRDYVISGGNKHTHTDQSASTLNEVTLPAAPITLPTNPSSGDTLIEHYSNADVFWTYNGTNWVRNFYSTKCCTTLNDETGSSFNPNLITSPVNPPDGTNGNALIEHFDNGNIYWQHDGTDWVYQFYDLAGNQTLHSHNDETGSSINLATLPTAPINPPSSPTLNDTLVEHYDNGNIFWTYAGSNWVRD